MTGNRLLLALSFALRDMRGGLRGFYIFVACLILGIGMITAVGSLSRSMTDALRADGQAILGGDLAIRTPHHALPDDVQAFLTVQMKARLSTVMEARVMARNAAGDSATLVEIKAVDDAWPLYGAPVFAGTQGMPAAQSSNDVLGRNDDGVFGAAVEASLLPRLNLAVGDKIYIGDQPFDVRAIIAREPDRIAGMGFSLAPRLLVSTSALAGDNALAGESLAEYGTRIALPDIRSKEELAEASQRLQGAFPDAVWTVRDSMNAAPRIERTINRLGLFLMLTGLTTLLVGGVGISNAVKGFLGSRLGDIATLKCLGASRRFVMSVYLWQIGVLSLLGIVAGIAVGVAGAAVAGDVLSDRFMLTPQSVFYPDVWLLSFVFGFLVTAIFSLWPLGSAVETRPAELFRDMLAARIGRPGRRVLAMIAVLALCFAALVVNTAVIPRYAFYFVVGAGFAFAVFYGASVLVQKLLQRPFAGLRPEIRMAMANISRPGNATTSIILSLGLGLTVLIGMAQVENSFSKLLKEDLAQDVPSFFFLDVQADQKDDFVMRLTSVPSVRSVQMTPSFRGRIVEVNGQDAEKMLVDRNEEWVLRSDRGFTYTGVQPAHSRIIRGEWWPEHYQGAPLVSIATNVARAFDIGVGDKLTINILGVDFTATVANVREIEWASFTMNFAVTFSPGVLETVPAPWIATAVMDADVEETLQANLAREMPNVTSVRVRDALETAQELLRAVTDAVRATALLTLVAGILVLAGGIAAARRRHVYDAVILKVLGATQRRVMLTFLAEYALLGLLTVAIAGLLGTLGGYAALNLVMDIPFRFSLPALAGVSAVALFVCLVAGFSGTWRAMRQPPAAYLRVD